MAKKKAGVSGKPQGIVKWAPRKDLAAEDVYLRLKTKEWKMLLEDPRVSAPTVEESSSANQILVPRFYCDYVRRKGKN